jgi:hypothetical protein
VVLNIRPEAMGRSGGERSWRRSSPTFRIAWSSTILWLPRAASGCAEGCQAMDQRVQLLWRSSQSGRLDASRPTTALAHRIGAVHIRRHFARMPGRDVRGEPQLRLQIDDDAVLRPAPQRRQLVVQHSLDPRLLSHRPQPPPPAGRRCSWAPLIRCLGLVQHSESAEQSSHP